MNVDRLGDIALVWSWQAFVFASVAGFLIGYVVSYTIGHRPDWRNDQPPLLVGWVTALVGVTAMFVLVMSQVLAALVEGDPLWTRVLSRLFVYMVGALFLGVGTGVGLYQRSK